MGERVERDESVNGAALRVVVSVVNQEQYDGGTFDFGNSYEDGTLDRVLASLNSIRDQIPEEFRSTARCEIESRSGYEGSHYASIAVSYTRPATTEEVAQWHHSRAVQASHREAQERATLAALQAKYGATG